jgi:hypothetical protein
MCRDGERCAEPLQTAKTPVTFVVRGAGAPRPFVPATTRLLCEHIGHAGKPIAYSLVIVHVISGRVGVHQRPQIYTEQRSDHFLYLVVPKAKPDQQR